MKSELQSILLVERKNYSAPSNNFGAFSITVFTFYKRRRRRDKIVNIAQASLDKNVFDLSTSSNFWSICTFYVFKWLLSKVFPHCHKSDLILLSTNIEYYRPLNQSKLTILYLQPELFFLVLKCTSYLAQMMQVTIF